MGKCKVKDEWLKRKDPNGFKVQSWAKKAGDHEIFCLVCETKINVDHGYSRVVQHAVKKCHVENCKAKLAPLQLRLGTFDINSSVEETRSPVVLPTSSSLLLNLCSEKEKALKAELLWAMKCVMSNYAISSNNDIKHLFIAMFGNAVPDGFCLSKAKSGYLITEALGPYFYQIVVKDIAGSAYTLCFDETTNESGKKELQIAIRYWSETEKKIVQKHVETFFLGHATGKEIHEKIILALSNANLALKNMLMLSCDGPNVNKTVLRLMNESLLAVREKSLIDIGTCSLHKVHNAFQKGLESMGDEVTQLVISIYYYFDGWPARWEDYCKVQKELNVKSHPFVKHSPSRWLTLGPAVERLIEQWPAIIKYFLKFFPSHATSAQLKSSQYQTIAKLLKSGIKAELLFIVDAATFFSCYLKIFQSEEPMVHKLYEEQNDLLLQLKSKVYVILQDNRTGEAVKKLPLTDIKYSSNLSNELTKMKDKDKNEFSLTTQKFYLAGYSYLKGQLQVQGSLLSDLRCLEKDNFRLTSSESQIISLGKALPFNVDICRLVDEWRILKFEDIKSLEDDSIDQYWSKIFAINNTSNQVKFPVVTKVVKAMLAFSHGSAAVERGFSASGNVLTSDKTSMNERGLNARLNVLSGLKKFDNKPYLVPITKELLLLASNAHKSYKSYLENVKKTNEIKEKEAQVKIQLKVRSEAASELKELSSSLIVKKSEEEKRKKAADKLLNEATKRLDSAIKRKNFEEMTLAQGMLQGVKQLRCSEEETSKELSSIVKHIGKKSSDITSFFKKQPKP